MNKKISAEEFRESLDRHASDLKANLLLAQSIIASEAKGEGKMKKKWTRSLVLALALFLALGTVAYGVTSMYRTVNWQGETDGNEQEPVIVKRSEAETAAWKDFDEFVKDKPDDEVVTAWYDNGEVSSHSLYLAKKVFRNAEDFREYLSGVPTLTAPSWLPEGTYESFRAEVSLVCNESGNYELIGSGERGGIHYNWFRVKEEDLVPCAYMMNLTLAYGNGYVVSSNLWSSDEEVPTLLEEGEQAEKISIRGMDDAVLIRNRKSSADVDLVMRKKLAEPVTVRPPYYGGGPGENGTAVCNEERIGIWKGGGSSLEDVVRFFSGE